MDQSEKLLLTVAEAAKLCSISRSKAYELISTKIWRSITIDGCRRVPRRWLEQWIEDQIAEQEKAA